MKSKMVRIVKFVKPVEFNSFNIQPGFYGLYAAGKLAAVSSGWCCDTAAYIYTRRGGRWYGRWVDSWNHGRLANFADYIIQEEEEEEEE